SIVEFFARHKMRNIIFEHHDFAEAPRTYIRTSNGRVIDGMWATPGIKAERCGYLEPQDFVGNHSMVWMDISGVAGMIMATMPLSTMVLAHYLVPGENLNPFKIMGFILGIIGVTILLGPVIEGGINAVWGAIAIFAAASCYAVNAILIKRLPRFSPMVGACCVLGVATLLLLPFWLFLSPENNAISQDSMIAVIWLGIGPTGIATIILFSVIDRAGPTFLSTINYLIPVVAFFSGAWILSEAVSWMHFLALGTILFGIAITRFRANQTPPTDNQ
ncbi:MAG: DMT family transporter, partial [Pseudomonadota bacterium]